MDFKVGSLSGLISGIESSPGSKSKKLFKQVPSEKEVNIKFQKVKIKKPKREVTDVGEETKPVNEDYIKLKPDKIIQKRKHYRHYESKPETDLPAVLCAEKRIKKKKRNENLSEKKEFEVFVGNVPNKMDKKKLIQLFRQYGKVESVRFRCAPLSDPRIPKKVAVIKKKFHPDRNSMHAYIRFEKVESAEKAVEANGLLYEGHHLIVGLESNKDQHDLKKAVFLGNVPFAAEEDDLWKIFESCGTISSIRIVRDRKTGVGKGFAYVNYENADAVELALELNGVELSKRNLRVSRCVKKPIKLKGMKQKSGKSQNVKVSNLDKLKGKKHKNEDSQNVKVSSLDNKVYSDKKPHKKQKLLKSKIKNEFKKETDMSASRDSNSNVMKAKDRSNKGSGTPSTKFQGQKVAEDRKLGKKKKKKSSKEELKKMDMIRKISSKSKPSMKKLKKPGTTLKTLKKMKS